MNGQRFTNAVSAIHRSLGTICKSLSSSKFLLSDILCSSTDPVNSIYPLNSIDPLNSDSLNSDSLIYEPFNTLNYSDDFSDVEPTFERANLSFSLMGTLLKELGLSEANDKAIAPCQVMTFLGIDFDTSVLEI